MMHSELSAYLSSHQVAGLAIVQRRPGVWCPWVHIGPTLADASGEPVDLEFSDLGRAYAWARSLGYHGPVEVDDSPGL